MSSDRRWSSAVVGSLASVLFAFLLGCAHGEAEREALQEAVHAYHRGLRWGEANNVASYLREPERSSFLEQRERLSDLKITNVTVSRVERVSADEAIVTAKIDWYRLSRGRLRSTTLRQTWQTRGGSWSISQQRWISGAPLGLFSAPDLTESHSIP